MGPKSAEHSLNPSSLANRFMATLRRLTRRERPERSAAFPTHSLGVRVRAQAANDRRRAPARHDPGTVRWLRVCKVAESCTALLLQRRRGRVRVERVDNGLDRA